MLGYKVPAPDEAMLISGGRAKSNAPFRVVTGHGAFILPIFRKARFLTLAMCEAEVAEKCVTQQGITLNVRSVIAFKVGNDTESIISACAAPVSPHFDVRLSTTASGLIFRRFATAAAAPEMIAGMQKWSIDSARIPVSFSSRSTDSGMIFRYPSSRTQRSSQ